MSKCYKPNALQKSPEFVSQTQSEAELTSVEAIHHPELGLFEGA